MVGAARSRGHEHRHLLQGGVALLTAMVVQALGGFVFWLVAARLTDADSVGRAGALVSSAFFVMYVTNFGLLVTVSRFAGRRISQDRLRFGIATLVSCATSFAGAVAYWVVLLRHRPQLGTGVALVVFAAATALLSASQLLDVRLTAARYLPAVVGRSLLVAIVKTALVVAFERRGWISGTWVFVAVVLPDVAFGALALIASGLEAARSRLRGGRLEDRTRLVRYAGFAYVSQLAMNAPVMVLPVIVLSIVPAEVNGAFFVAWGITGVVFLVPQAAMFALQMEGGRDGTDPRVQFRLSLLATTMLTGAAFVLSFVVALAVAPVYGEDFQQAGRLLPWLVAGTVPWSVVVLSLSDARVRDRERLSVLIGVVSSAACLPLAWWLTAVHGVDGTAVAWVVGAGGAAIGASVMRRSDVQRAVSLQTQP